MTRYISRQVATGVPVKNISRHVLGLFQGLPGAKRWRRYISENAHRDDTNDRLLLQAMDHMRAQLCTEVTIDSAMVQGGTLE